MEAGGEPMIFYTITYNNIQNRINLIRCWVKLWIGKNGKNFNVGEDEL